MTGSIRADREDLANAGDARRNRRHQQRRRQWVAATRDVTPDAIERRDALLDPDAGDRADRPRARDLLPRDPPDVARGEPERLAHLARRVADALFDLRGRHLDRSRQPVELAGEGKQRRVSPLANARDDPGHPASSRGSRPGRRSSNAATPSASLEEMMRTWSWYRRCRVPDPRSPQSTILLSGYSTIPSARAALRRGIRSRTARSSMIVLTATHS